MPNRVGQKLGHYQLVRLLGRGGFAEVYLGEHLYLKRSAALKILNAQLTSGDLQDFLKEAQAIASLSHPNIITVLDFGMDSAEQAPYLVMDYAPNGTLRQRHPKGSIVPLSTVVTYVKQIAAALNYAHEKKLIHCDIKPENMLLDNQNTVLLSDFGIAATAHSTTSLKTQAYAGTVHYSAPEQLQGRPRRASDQYALAAVVYEWLTGKGLFDGSQHIAIAMQHLIATPEPLRARIPTISSEVEQVVPRALSKEPENRFKNMLAFATALEQASQTQAVIVGETLLTYPSGAIAVAWSPDSTRIASVHHDMSGSAISSLHVWDAQTGHPLFVCDCPQYSRCGSTIMYSPDGTRIATPSNGRDLIDATIWNASDGSLIANAEGQESYNDYSGYEVAWSPDGKFVASVNCGGLLSIRDAVTATDVLNRAKLTSVLNDPIESAALAWSPNGKYIAHETGVGWGVIEVVQIQSPSRVELVDTSLLFTWVPGCGAALHLAWSPNGRLIAGTFEARPSSVFIWDVQSGQIILNVGSRFFRGTSWSPDSTKIALTSYDGEIIIYDVIMGSSLFTYKNHRREIVNRGEIVRGGIASWSPDGTRVASMDDNTVQIWKVT